MGQPIRPPPTGQVAPPRRRSDWLRRLAARARALLIDSRARSEFFTRLRFPDRVHQDVSLSWIDRYPRLFSSARTLLADRPAPRILSFGCAAGEELVSLRAYFPSAQLIGAEINPALRRACAKLSPDSARQVIASRPEIIAAHGPYDAIFCMAVFTRRPHTVESQATRDLSAHYPFALFANDLRQLAAQLAPGGLLIVEHALYLAEDALAEMPVTPVREHGDWLAKGPRFDPTGHLIEPQPEIFRIFRRTA